VKYETNKIIKPLIVTKCMVTTFMSNDPNTSENATLENPIDRPKNEGKRVREEMEVSGGNVEKESY
jgi:hypothetical protein